MSPGEVAGLAATVGLLAGISGAVIVTVVVSRRRTVTEGRAQCLDACITWLAARRTVSRTCALCVAAVRALEAEPHDSPYDSSRITDAQRAKHRWVSATRDLDQAEAALIARTAALAIGAPPVPSNPGPRDLVRQAIGGRPRDMDMLFEEFRQADLRAEDYTRDLVVRLGGPPLFDRWCNLLTDVTVFIETIVDRWSQPP